jgi:hypothetical protein
MKEKKTLKKLELKKETVANLNILTRKEMSEVEGAFRACWENLWTLYYCTLIWTGDQKPETVDCPPTPN